MADMLEADGWVAARDVEAAPLEVEDALSAAADAAMFEAVFEERRLGIKLVLARDDGGRTAVVVDEGLDVVHRTSTNFDAAFPWYGTENGMHASADGVATSPVAMWLDGLDAVLREVPGSLLEQVDGVSFSGQQHGSVFWKHGAAAKLSSLNPSDTIADQVPTVSVISLAQCMLSFQRPSRYRMVRYGWTPAPRLSTYPLAIIDPAIYWHRSPLGYMVGSHLLYAGANH